MRIVTTDTMRDERRKTTATLRLPYQLRGANGEMQSGVVEAQIANGEIDGFEFDVRASGELMTTPAGLESVVRKSVVDIQIGRETVPLLYQPIYRRIENPDFTRHVDTTFFSQAQVVFLEKMEAEEVKFGTRTIGPLQTVPITAWAAGLQWTEEMRIFDPTWEIGEANRAIGEAYNALLNHLHFAPILSYAYQAKNQTPASTVGATYLEKLRNTLRDGLQNANADRITTTRRVRQPSILLAHPKHRWDLEIALGRMVIGGTEYPALGNSPLGGGLQTMIFYDGYEAAVGDRTYTYPGVPADKVYLIDPGPGRNHFVELVKHDLLVDAGGADITRLVEDAIVARTYRGLFANVVDSVEEVTLPA